MEYIDQILFWDTNYQGIVNLSRSKTALNRKLMANHLIGGHLIIRPAELFEGDEFYFNSAIKEDGMLYQLLKNGMASLALDSDISIENRADWRFNKEVVFDRGLEIKTSKQLDAVKKRTYDRAESLDKVGWGNAPIQTKISENERMHNMNQRFRLSMLAVGKMYFPEEELLNSSLGAYILSGVNVASRSDLYPKIDDDWSQLVRENQRENFKKSLKESLTFSATLTTSESFGGRISDIKNQTLYPLVLENNFDNAAYETFELEAANLFIEAMKLEISINERENDSFISSIRNMDASRFVESSVRLISPIDRKLLLELIYGQSKYLGEMSIVQFLATESLKLSKKDKIKKMRGRIQELESDSNRSANRIAILRSGTIAASGEALLMLIGINAPFLVTGAVMGLDFLFNGKSAIFAGFRTPIQ